MVEITRENAEKLEFVPTPAENDADQASCKNHARGQAVNVVMAKRDGRIAQKEREASHYLGVVAQGVYCHPDRYNQHNDGVSSSRVQDVHRAHVVDGIGGKEQQRPASADTRSPENAITIFLF